MMSNYSWNGWGFLPIPLNQKSTKMLLEENSWKPWYEGKNENQIKDIRSFYSRSAVQIFRPLTIPGRMELDLSDTLTGHLELVHEEYKIKIDRLQLVCFDEVSLIYVHLSSHKKYTAEQISNLNRSVFSWRPRSVLHKVSLWRDQQGNECSLNQYITTTLGIFFDEEVDYSDDFFGHELASCTLITGSPESKGELCVSELSAGIDITNKRYALNHGALESMRANQFNYWDDWTCQFNLNRWVFLDHTPEDAFSSLSYNLGVNNYYLDLMALIVYQKIMMNKFIDDLTLSSDKKNNSLYKKIASFRQKSKIGSVSTYPFAQELYKYLNIQAGIEDMENRTFDELEHNYRFMKQEKADIANSVTLWVSLIAAILLPASSIATIFALTNSQMNTAFWSLTTVFTLFTLIAIFGPILSRNKK